MQIYRKNNANKLLWIIFAYLIMNEGLISVIVPVFNVERYLSACLDSILSQSFKNLEVIVINDGSTDFSLQIAETYAEKDDRVKVYSFDNEGLSEARNRGLSVATGEFITFVDADDLLFPDALKVLYKIMIKEASDIVEGRTIKGKTHVNPDKVTAIKKFNYNAKEAISDVLYQKRLLPSVCGKLFKRMIFKDLFFEKGILYEDLNIFYRIFERCTKIIWVDFPVYFYRINDESLTNKWKVQRLDVLKVTENLEEYIREKYPDLLLSAHDRRLSANFNMFALCSIHGDYGNASQCWAHIKERRQQSLFNPRVRLKNKAGIILSYFGKNIFNLAARKIYK